MQHRDRDDSRKGETDKDIENLESDNLQRANQTTRKKQDPSEGKLGIKAANRTAPTISLGATPVGGATSPIASNRRSDAFRAAKKSLRKGKEASSQNPVATNAGNDWETSPSRATATAAIRRSEDYRQRKKNSGQQEDSAHARLPILGFPSSDPSISLRPDDEIWQRPNDEIWQRPDDEVWQRPDDEMWDSNHLDQIIDGYGRENSGADEVELPPTLEAHLVVDEVIDVHAVVVDERGKRKRTVAISSVALLVVAGVSVGATFAATRNQTTDGSPTVPFSSSTAEPTFSGLANSGPTTSPITMIRAPQPPTTVQPEDFVKPYSRCFTKLEDLYVMIDRYVVLQASAGNYSTEEDQADRQQIADEYGWPIGEWCTYNLESLRSAFSPKGRDNASSSLGFFNEDISSWNVSKVTCFTDVFWGAWSFNQPLNSWDVSNAVYMDWMFEEADVFNQPLSEWKVSKVENFNGMFSHTQAFNQNLSSWDVSSATTMFQMFDGSTEYNGDISTWNVSNVESMEGMFLCDTRSNFNANISSWDVARVTSMANMFVDAFSFNQDLSRWNVARVETMTGMFYECESFDQDLSRWNTSRVVDMSRMFDRARTFNSGLSRWDTSSVTTMFDMFYESELFNSDISSWDVSRVEEMYNMFKMAPSFNQNLSSWRPEKVTTYSNMFEKSSNFSQDLCSWGTYMSRLDGIGTNSMFAGSGCDVQSDPDLSVIPVGPLCVECPSISCGIGCLSLDGNNKEVLDQGN